jgi:hypothetical protein
MRERTSGVWKAFFASAGILAWIAGAWAEVQPISKEFPADKIGLIDVQTELGPVRIAGTDSKTVKVDVLDADPVKCRVTMELRKRTLLLKAERPKKWLFDAAQCPSGFRVQMPKALPLDAASGVGSIEIAQTSAKTSIKTGSGNVKLVNVSGDLNARLGNGSVEGEAASKILDVSVGNGRIGLKGLGASVAAQVGNGEIRLEWGKPAKRGRCDVKTGSGEITLVFPEGSKLSVQALSAAGKTVNDFPNAKGRAFTISALSGSGNISVRLAAPLQK